MGGNVFQGTSDFDQKDIPAMMAQLNPILAKIGIKGHVIGSGATPTAGKKSGDLDVMIDQDVLAQKFKISSPKDIKIALEKMLQQSGFETAKSGVNVHVKVVLDDTAHQVDLMVVPHAELVSKFHVHDLPKGSPYKGKNKQLAIWWLSKQAGYNWSAFKGLVDAQTKEVISRDMDQIAKMIIGPNASARDLGSVESIMAALPSNKANSMLADLKQNPDWSELPTESVELERIKQLSGLTLNSVRMI